MVKPKPTSSAVDRLSDYLVKQVRERGLMDVHFFPTTDSTVTVEEAAEAVLALMLEHDQEF